MRITIVQGAFFPVPPLRGGAVEKVWFALGKEFAGRGHEVMQISRALPELPAMEELDGVQHVRIRGFDQPASGLRLKLADLIYSLGAVRVLPSADILVTNTFWLPLLARRPRQGQLYVHVARFPKGQMRFYRRAARLQTPSSAIAEAIESEAPQLAARTRVIPYPTPQSPRTPRPFNERERIMLYAGRVHPEKGVHLLVQAFAEASASTLAEWKLRVLGPTDTAQGGGGKSYLDKLRALAGGDARIEFRPPVFDSAALAAEMERARIFVYPSLAETGETFGLAALEAMAAGCAVVVSDLACFRDFVADGETGFVFEHRSAAPAETLRQRLIALAGNDELTRRVADAGRQKSAQYSIEKVAAEFLQDFATIAG